MTALVCKCSDFREKYPDHPHLSHCPLYIKRKYDMTGSYRAADMPVWADHCGGCGKWAHVIAGNQNADEIVWTRTVCEHCGIMEVESTWYEDRGWVTVTVPVSTIRSDNDIQM